jgi:dUTP pyrophosphatase
MKRLIETKIISNTDRERELLEAHYNNPYATPGSAGIDLLARLPAPLDLHKGDWHLFPTGLAVNMQDPNLVSLVTSRSGLNLKHGIRVSQGVGVIDADYHAEIGVILFNDSDTPYTVQPYDKIAQLLFMPVVQVDLRFVDTFSTVTARGLNGFGSSGR